MDLLFLNALKGLKTKKVQMFCIVFCIILSTSIYTAMNLALDRMEDRYHNYLKEQNVEDFAFTLKVDYSKDYTKEEVQNLIENELKDLPQEQMQIVKQYQMTIGMQNVPNLDNLHQAIDYIFNNNGANDKKLEEKVSQTKEKYEFEYTKSYAKTMTDEKMLYQALIYDEDATIDIPYLVEGKMPESDNEITLLPEFANLNNIGINSKYKIGDKEYTVVGFAYAPQYIFPMISISRPIFNENTDCIIYMNSNTFNEFGGLQSTSYIAAFNDREKLFDFETLFDLFQNDENITLSPMSAMNIMRVNVLEAEIATDRLFAKYFLYLLLGISVFVIIVITKKRIEDERLQIGVLKSLGYKSYKIAISYLVYPIIGSIIGGTIGFFIGVPVHTILTKMYVSYFNLPITGFGINYKYLLDSLLIPTIMLSLLAFFIALFMLRKKPLQLLKEGSNLKVNIFSRIVTLLTRRLPFKTRFKLSLASRSLGKLFIVTLTSFCTGLLIVLILIGMNMFSSMIDKTFDGLEFDNMVSYQSARDDESKDDDLIYSLSLDMPKVQRTGEEESELFIGSDNDDTMSVTVSGIDDITHFITIKDKEGNSLQELLKEDNDIIININIAEVANVDVGDYIILKGSDDKEYKYKVVGIQDAFMGTQAYTKREPLSIAFEGKLSYNQKYTCDSKYSNMSNIEKEELDMISGIFNISDLKANMENQMQASSGSIYFVISFASVLALIIILVIANIIVEENKKTISLMKVMGYRNKEVSQVVLNIYTPFVIIAYILSIPVMKSILKAIVKALTGDMSLAIPIEFSLIKAIVGLIGLLIAYYIAIFISRKSLNKVPLSVALKRE